MYSAYSAASDVRPDKLPGEKLVMAFSLIFLGNVSATMDIEER